MSRSFLLLLLAGLAAGCSRTGNDQLPVSGPAEEPARQILSGQAAYEKVCADCHEEGVDGAPAVGDQDAWQGRSSLWVAVLAEHAKSGYLEMPAKGGEPGLSDDEVAAAAAYMMSLIYPDQPIE